MNHEQRRNQMTDRKEYQKAWREAHKDKCKAKQKAYYQANKEHVKAKQKAYYQAHKEEMKAYMKAYYQDNKEKVKEYYHAHKDKRKPYYQAYMKEYMKSDVNSLGQMKQSIRAKSQRYLKKYGTKIPGYQIHHCCTYTEPYKFIYCSKEFHHLIHAYLKQHNIDADSDHYEQIKHLLDDSVVKYNID